MNRSHNIYGRTLFELKLRSVGGTYRYRSIIVHERDAKGSTLTELLLLGRPRFGLISIFQDTSTDYLLVSDENESGFPWERRFPGMKQLP